MQRNQDIRFDKTQPLRIAHQSTIPHFKPRPPRSTFTQDLNGKNHPYCYSNYHPTNSICLTRCTWPKFCIDETTDRLYSEAEAKAAKPVTDGAPSKCTR